jgi:hypothetical protein
MDRERKLTRAPGIDYRQPGPYFVTICVDIRGLWFGDVRPEGVLILNDAGELDGSKPLRQNATVPVSANQVGDHSTANCGNPVFTITFFRIPVMWHGIGRTFNAIPLAGSKIAPMKSATIAPGNRLPSTCSLPKPHGNMENP